MIGMDDADIAHSIMTVKEMEHKGYGLNGKVDVMSNDGILTGDRPFIQSPLKRELKNIPQFKVPKFQPAVLSRVPTIERSKLLFPINLADFIYQDGIQIIGSNEMDHRMSSKLENEPK